jgi:hypothetical protein
VILFKKFGDLGRIGNQLFQLAFVVALSKRGGMAWSLPSWKFAKYFRIGAVWSTDKDIVVDQRQEEPFFHYSPDFASPQNHNLKKNIDFVGYYQTEKYFIDVWGDIKELFMFEDWFLRSIENRGGFKPDDACVAVHVRRGDYVGNGHYVNIPSEYYVTYFIEHPDLKFYVFSDDYGYCKLHFQFLSNVEYVEKCHPIEHLCLMSQFKRHMIANSSFSWWGAKLAESYNDDVQVIRPDGLFLGGLAERSIDTDFYPDRWDVRALNQQIDLSDVTFVIPVAYDHAQRKKNLELIVCMLQRNFKTNIIVGEQGENQRFTFISKWVRYHHFNGMMEFHRTKMLNEMIMMENTPIVVNYDADVLVAPGAMYAAVQKIRDGVADFVYPYQRFARVPRVPHKDNLVKSLDVGILHGIFFPGLENNARVSYGGAVVMRKSSFVDAGMENENFISWGREDFERVWRFRKLGYIVDRVDGNIYHINHFVGENSFKLHPHYQGNNKEAAKIRRITPDDLREYIKTWPWTQKCY